MKTYFLYKTTNIITGRYYVGMHVHNTARGKDYYLGSGLVLKQSIKKYGRKNHKRNILSYYETFDALIQAETELITTDLLADPLCMNLRLGGKGGHHGKKVIYTNEMKDAARKRTSSSWKDPEIRRMRIERMKDSVANMTQEERDKKSIAIKRMVTPERREAMRVRAKLRWQDPNYRNKMSEMSKRVGADRKNATSKTQIEVWSKEERKAIGITHLNKINRDPYLIEKRRLTKQKKMQEVYNKINALALDFSGVEWQHHVMRIAGCTNPQRWLERHKKNLIAGRESFRCRGPGTEWP